MDDGNEELDDICADLDALVEVIRGGLREAKSLRSYEAKENKLTWLEDRISRAKTVYESLQLEIRSHGKENVAMKVFKERARNYKETINELIQETNAVKAEQGGAVHSTEEIMLQHSERFTTGQLLQQGITVQERSIASLERQLQLIESSKQIATETMAELARQEEQLLKIAEDVTKVKENLTYAGKQLRSIARRMAGDQAFRVCCILLMVVLIIIIIIVAVVPPNQLGSIFAPGGGGTTSSASNLIPSVLLTVFVLAVFG